MSEENNKIQETAIPVTSGKGVNRREFFKLASGVAAGAGLATTFTGCSSNTSVLSTSPAASSAWKFGIMCDTQWTGVGADDGYDPYTCAASVIKQLNDQFLANGVKFVVHLGDLCDDGSVNGEDFRAAMAQSLYNNNIGLFPMRGNHDNSATDAAEFVKLYPQTQNGAMNSTPASVLTAALAVSPDASNLALPAKTGSAFTLGSNFSSPSTTQTGGLNYTGLTYACDVNNVRLVVLDQFTPIGYDASTGNAGTVDITTTVAKQQSWITSALSGRSSSVPHAFVFSHKGLITENHVDVLFGATPAANASATDAFIASMADNNAKMYFCGHDHMHNRSLVYNTAGSASSAAKSVMHVLTASDSSKFYTPKTTANDVTYNTPTRQVQISQELYTIGFYIVTVDGNNVNVDFYSADVSTFVTSGENALKTVPLPALNFTLRESFGYSLVGKQFRIAQGAAFTGVSDTSPNGTTMAIAAGKNLSVSTDASSRAFERVVNTGWKSDASAASDVLTLWGMQSKLGSSQCEPYVLKMNYSASKLSSSNLAAGKAGIATIDDSYNWTNAVNSNIGGTKKFVAGACPTSTSTYPVGAYGVDTTNNIAWAVLNYGGKFAVVDNI